MNQSRHRKSKECSLRSALDIVRSRSQAEAIDSADVTASTSIAQDSARGVTTEVAPDSTPGSRLSMRIRAAFVRGAALLSKHVLKPNQQRKLQLLEMQQLGEKRFVAIVQAGKQKFLIGGAAASVSLLAELHASQDTAVVLRSPGEEHA